MTGTRTSLRADADTVRRVLEDYAGSLYRERHGYRDAVAALARLVEVAERTEAAEKRAKEVESWIRITDEVNAAAEAERDAAQAEVTRLNHENGALDNEIRALRDALRGLLADDDLPYPPDGDECFCSMCKAVRVARAALDGPETKEQP